MLGSPLERTSAQCSRHYIFTTHKQSQHSVLFRSDNCFFKSFPEGSTLLSVGRGQHVCEDEGSPD